MDKKIISICFLLIVVIAVTVTYVVSNQPSSEENHQNYVPDEDIFGEIDGSFISEDDEIDIGEMV